MARTPQSPRPFLETRGRALTGTGGVQYTRFRSQFEIRFAMELETRKIRWFYEPERLGEGRYLVDFFLPDAKLWIELKGVFKTRDHIVLRQVADLVARERGHKLFLFMPRKAYIVGPGDFKAMTHETFWQIIMRLVPTAVPPPPAS